jgi:subtilisin family serine protease
MKTIAAAVALASLAVAPAGASQPAEFRPIATLTARDPLQAPAPALNKALRLPEESRPVGEKLVSDFWDAFADKADGTTSRIIVTLHEPLLEVDGLDKAAIETLRREAIAAIEHQFAAKARSLGGQNLRGLSSVPVVFLDATSTQTLAIAGLPEVRALEPNRMQAVSRSEGQSLIRSGQLRDSLGATGSGVGIAIVDSGVDAFHPEFGARVVAQGNTTAEAGSGASDPHGHGTGVAGIAAGAQGVATLASLWAVRACNSNGQCPQEQVIVALDLLFDARGEFGGLDVVNMSLGGGRFNAFCDSESPSYALATGRLWDAGITVLAASGNDEYINGVSMPACLTRTIAVGAVADSTFVSQACGPVTADTIMCYSNSGFPLDILAPSECARTPAPGGGYNNCFNGTSAATPYAAGVAAQLLSVVPGSSPAEILVSLGFSGVPLTDVNFITRNRIDAVDAYAILSSLGGDTCTPSDEIACLIGGRFEVSIGWVTNSDSGPGRVMSFNGARASSDQSAFFWFFNAENFEMGVKMVDACSFNGQYWVFVSGLTNQGFEVTVRDTVTGTIKRYINPLGKFPTTVGDTSAFSCN